MTLGSPTSPKPGAQFLPGFLMGDLPAPVTPQPRSFGLTGGGAETRSPFLAGKHIMNMSFLYMAQKSLGKTFDAFLLQVGLLHSRWSQRLKTRAEPLRSEASTMTSTAPVWGCHRSLLANK